MNQLAREIVFIVLVHFHQTTERCARDDAEVAVERAFVFLIGDERINFPAADEHDVADFSASSEFL